MASSDFIPLFVLIGLVNEFGLKALFEVWRPVPVRDSPLASEGLSGPGSDNGPNPVFGRGSAIRHYVLYRICAWIAHSVAFAWLFQPPLIAAIAAGAVLSFAGSTELLTALAGSFVHARTSQPARYLHVLYAAGLLATLLAMATATGWEPSATATALDDFLHASIGSGLPVISHWFLIFFAAWIPANDLIRWLMNKRSDRSLADDVVGTLWEANPHAQDQQLKLAETAAAKDAVSTDAIDEGTFRAGRVIGVLERWLLLAFLIRGELAAIGFIFTAKSIVRFREFRKTEFTEYYLVGTLYSILITLGLALFFPR